jgi:hypothetical protein
MENIQKEVEELNETPKSLTEDEIRDQVIEKFGLSEDENSELIDKLVKDKVIETKKFSTAISQKINWRTKAQELESKGKPESKTEVPVSTVVVKEPVFDENKVLELLDKRELDSLDLSDSLKKEASNYAKLNNVSIKKALSSDYISFLKEKEEKNERISNASLGNSRKPVTKDYGSMKPSDFNLKTPEGKAEFAKYEDELRKKLG